jgi:2-dehydro-3-deoxygluconokinase
MVMLTAVPAAPLRHRPQLAMYVGGAESNVACGLAHLGHKVEWLSRLGDDPLGDSIEDFLVSRGVGTTRVARDPERPTGVYFKDSADQRTKVYYYRSGSAAAAMSRSEVDPQALRGARLLHVSGITPALSPTCNDLVQALIVDRPHDVPTVSFDVNYRPGLWSVAEAAPRLRELALAADVVVVGRDEAQTLWGTTTSDEVRELLPDVPQLVVKDNDVGATCFSEEGTSFQPALEVRVVEPVGAGDAFAAGYLSGLLQGLTPDVRLRHGHVLAALTLQHNSDLPVLPDPRLIASWAGLVGPDWATLDLDHTAAEQPSLHQTRGGS